MDPLSLVEPGGKGKMGGKDKKGRKGKAGQQQQQQQQKHLVWKDRWVVIHQGVLNLCKHRMVSSSFLHLPSFFCSFVRSFIGGSCRTRTRRINYP
jgi:hypothetical protein